jgi:ribonuclease HII
MLSELMDFEKDLYKRGVRLIAGVDEVGRGPLAGPFVAGAVILDLEKIIQIENTNLGPDTIPRNNDVENEEIMTFYNLIRDSKKVSPKRRESINNFLITAVLSYSIVEISPEELDEIGISETTQKAFFECILKLKVKPEHILTDTFRIKKIIDENQTNINQGDNKSVSIAAASIMAKVYRDKLMEKMHIQYPHYGFDHNKGYGTKQHFSALNCFGICPIHRKSFRPVKNVLATGNTNRMSGTITGAAATGIIAARGVFKQIPPNSKKKS